jgi:D-alanine-D-alanine ligase-like ATP-grasp enzyme
MTEANGHVEYEDLVEGLSVAEQTDESTGITNRVVVDTKGNVRGEHLKPAIVIKDGRGKLIRLTRGTDVLYAYQSNLAFEPLVPYFACGDKALTAARLAEAGLPVPRSAAFELSEYDRAQRFFAKLDKPAVTKPARGTSGGAGVTLDITRRRDFRAGFARAAAHLRGVLVEQQVAGEHLRITVLAGSVIGAVHRVPAYVTGDGRASVASLVERKNALWRAGSPENRLLRPIGLDGEANRLLKRQGLAPNSVVPEDRDVWLRDVCNADEGGEIVEVTDSVHPDHRDMALAAADVLGPVLSGVDLIVPDLRTGAGAVINEVNTTPSLYVINGMRDGAPSHEASERILRHLFGICP